MRVPLSVGITRNKETNEESLIITRNGRNEKIPLPFKPFILVQRDKFNDVHGPIECWTKVPENIAKEYIRINFDKQQDLKSFITNNKDRKQYIFHNTYIEQLLISHENFFYNYPHTNSIKVMFYDIEVATKGDGMFPKPINNEVICIGYSIWEYYTNGTKKKTKQCLIDTYNETDLDKHILEKFRDDIKSEDPDIIAGFNSDDFDWPYLIERYQLMHISMAGIGRNDKEIYINNDTITIPGRINFDIYNSNSGVSKDQTLSGIKSKTLKELSRFYKVPIDDIELPHHIENLLQLWKDDPDLLYSYQEADILRTEGVGNVYIRNCITLAEMLGIPLNNVINMYSSLIPKLFLGRNMEKEKLINTETNFQRYNKENGTIAKLGTKYEGALVGLYKDGFFPEVYKLDFSSMYPSAVQTWGLGPDTTSLVEVKPYTGKYSFSRDSKYNWYNIPDENFKCNLVVKVRNDKEGFLVREISRLKQERKRLKGELKTCKADEYETIYSQQNAIKVILNSIYGILGLKSSIYGDTICGLMITAMCRWTTGNVIRWFRDELIELDTDGLILNKKVDEDEVNERLDKLMKDRFGFDENHMKMELEEFGRAYFYAMKNYVVQEGDKFIKHGVTLKSSKTSKVVDRAIDLAIDHWFNNKSKEEVLREAYDFTNLGIEWFEERVKLSKEKREYDDQTDAKLLLAKQVEMKTGQVCKKGTQMNFVVTKTQLPFKELRPYYKKGAKWNYVFVKYVDNISELNMSYYEQQIDKTLERFGIRRNEQIDFFEELDINTRVSSNKKPLNVVPKDDI